MFYLSSELFIFQMSREIQITNFLKGFIYLFLERRKGKQKEGNTDVEEYIYQLPIIRPHTGPKEIVK